MKQINKNPVMTHLNDSVYWNGRDDENSDFFTPKTQFQTDVCALHVLHVLKNMYSCVKKQTENSYYAVSHTYAVCFLHFLVSLKKILLGLQLMCFFILFFPFLSSHSHKHAQDQ